MSKVKMCGIGSLLSFSVVVFLAAPGHSQEFPKREIHSIVNFPPGSGMDIMIRYYSNKLSQLAGTPVIVENKPGANGNIATEYVARSKPDGYTIYINPASSTLAAASALYKKLSFDPVKDLQPVLLLTKLGFVFAVDARSPVRSISDLTTHLQQKPGNGAYGVTANTGVVSAELYKTRAKLQTVQVDYKGTGELLNDLNGGHLDFISLAPTALAEPIRAGKLRGLAVTSNTRLRIFPEIPTMAEAGFPGFDMTPWIGLSVAAGTPQDVTDKLAMWHREINAAEETKNMLLTFGMDPLEGDSSAMAALLKSDIERWKEYVELAKIEVQ